MEEKRLGNKHQQQQHEEMVPRTQRPDGIDYDRGREPHILRDRGAGHAISSTVTTIGFMRACVRQDEDHAVLSKATQLEGAIDDVGCYRAVEGRESTTEARVGTDVGPN